MLAEDTDGARSGTQAVERAIHILREVASRGHLGWQLSDLAARCGLSKTTAHRLLTCLVRERMVRQQPGGNLYLPGPMLFELGLAALPERGELQYVARNRLASLARQTAAVAFLFFRSGDDLVCAVRVGTARLEAKALAILPGTRKPLVVAAGGVAILMAMPAMEARLTIDRNFANLEDYTASEVAGMRRMLERSFAEGLAVSAGDVLPRVHAVGLPLRDASGAAYGAIAIAGPARRLPLDRAAEFARMLKAIADELEALPA
ncbi:MAG: helix-turn-helix domain-containing protein [Sphingomonadales bacterium]|nr:helix-turn-helix domain-containing protein [Sphingomonadales bacterium]